MFWYSDCVPVAGSACREHGLIISIQFIGVFKTACFPPHYAKVLMEIGSIINRAMKGKLGFASPQARFSRNYRNIQITVETNDTADFVGVGRSVRRDCPWLSLAERCIRSPDVRGRETEK